MPAKTEVVFDYLCQCAREMRTVTYKEVAGVAVLAKPGVGRPLGYIRDQICLPRGLPWLNALVVNKKTRRPGDSFLPPGVELSRADELLWRGMVLQVFTMDWNNVPFVEETPDG